jgi:hypothetical protein
MVEGKVFCSIYCCFINLIFCFQIDFDKWKSEEDFDEEEERRDVRKDFPEIYKNLQKEELGYRKGIHSL